MNAVALAARDARRLITKECEAGAYERLVDAIPAVARRLKSSPGSLWALLFRPPKHVCGDLLMALDRAVNELIEREIKELEHELATRRATALEGRRSDPRTLAEVEEGIARLKALLNGGHHG